MNVRLFEGPAGSGKTTRLFQVLGEHLALHPLREQERVLALTKMHGSRRRMAEKLASVPAGGRSAECITLNSFALGLVQRWRSLARTIRDPLPGETEFAAVAEVASVLLQRDGVVGWVVARHPVLVVDELQDLRGPELAVVKGLARGLAVFCAADEFQDLDPQAVCEGVEWATAGQQVEALIKVHRTKVPALLTAARAIRAGTAPAGGPGFKVFATANANVTASFMARNLTWSGAAQVAVISPAGPEKSSWVRETLARLAEKPFVQKDGKRFGPFTLPWEEATSDELARWCGLLALEGDRAVSAHEIIGRQAELPGPIIDWVRSRARLAGEVSFNAEVVRAQLGRCQALLRGHGTFRAPRHLGLKAHQAKNREFDRVILLWPVTVGGGPEVTRRLLYNAVTRARHDCMVLVQDPDPKKSRLQRTPFA